MMLLARRQGHEDGATREDGKQRRVLCIANTEGWRQDLEYVVVLSWPGMMDRDSSRVAGGFRSHST
jgi:hypothetical protein